MILYKHLQAKIGAMKGTPKKRKAVEANLDAVLESRDVLVESGILGSASQDPSPMDALAEVESTLVQVRLLVPRRLPWLITLSRP